MTFILPYKLDIDDPLEGRIRDLCFLVEQHELREAEPLLEGISSLFVEMKERHAEELDEAENEREGAELELRKECRQAEELEEAALAQISDLQLESELQRERIEGLKDVCLRMRKLLLKRKEQCEQCTRVHKKEV